MPRPESGTDPQRGGFGSRFGSGGEYWLCPSEDRRRLDPGAGRDGGGARAGELPATGELLAGLYREGKATLSLAVAEILDRLGSSADPWDARLKTLSQGSSRAASSPPRVSVSTTSPNDWA